MYIVLLSGGSGKRLWPLSNDLCSKQYIKLMNHDEEQENREKCSMLQRVFGQLKNVGLSENTIVCASSAQVELIESQLDGAAEVAVEPMRRDTFPAVMLSCFWEIRLQLPRIRSVCSAVCRLTRLPSMAISCRSRARENC